MCDFSDFLREIEPACGIGLPRVRTPGCQSAIAAAAAARGGSACLAMPLFDRGPPIAPYVCWNRNTPPPQLSQLCTLAGYGAGPEAKPGASPGARDTGTGASPGAWVAGLGLAGVGLAGVGLAGRTGWLLTRPGREKTKAYGGIDDDVWKSIHADVDRIHQGQTGGFENKHITPDLARELKSRYDSAINKNRARDDAVADIYSKKDLSQEHRLSF